MRPTDADCRELQHALEAPQPEIPCRYLYDDRGSELYEEIVTLEEYYLTRTEEAILEAHAAELVADVEFREIVELGSGAGRKIRTLLDALVPRGLERCVLVDVNQTFLDASVERLATSYPTIEVTGLVADFERDLAKLGPGGGRLVVFFAGTIGNLEGQRAEAFLQTLTAGMAPDDRLLIGFGLVTDPARLVAAYDDGRGVTAAFNKNVLGVLNHRFGADFDLATFEHVALWDAERSWIEMRLRSDRDQVIHVPAAGVELRLSKGDEIRTEISAKFTRESVERLARAANLEVDGWTTDADDLFALARLRRGPA